MTIQDLANRCARRAGYAKATCLVADRRRRFGCAIVKASKGRRSKGRWIATKCVVAYPAHWDEPETVAFPVPEIEYTRTIPTKQDWDRFSKFRRLARFNSFEYAYEKAYHRKPEDVYKQLDDFIAAGVLIGPHPRDQAKPKPRFAKGRGLFTEPDNNVE